MNNSVRIPRWYVVFVLDGEAQLHGYSVRAERDKAIGLAVEAGKAGVFEGEACALEDLPADLVVELAQSAAAESATVVERHARLVAIAGGLDDLADKEAMNAAIGFYGSIRKAREDVAWQLNHLAQTGVWEPDRDRAIVAPQDEASES